MRVLRRESGQKIVIGNHVQIRMRLFQSVAWHNPAVTLAVHVEAPEPGGTAHSCQQDGDDAGQENSIRCSRSLN